MTGTLRTRFPFSPLHDMPPGRLRWHLPELTRCRILLRRSIHRSMTTLRLVSRSAGATRPVNQMVIGIQMVTRNPPSPRSPRARAPTRIQSPHPNGYLLIHPMHLITSHVVNGHRIRLAPPNIILIILPLLESLLETPPITLPHLANPLITPFLTQLLESPRNSVTRAVSLRPRAPYTHNITTARFQGMGTPLPTTTLLPLLNPTFRNPNNPPPHSPF